MSYSRGQILIQDVYAQGKMLDHSGWAGQLPRRITPSDVDMRFSFHHSRRSIEIELKFNCADWQQVSYGQRLAYMDEVEAHRGKKIAVVASHNISSDRQIDTFNDITAYQVMYWDKTQIRCFTPSLKFSEFVKLYANLP